MEKLSKEYGWTPEQIRNTDIQDIRDYILIIQQKNALEKAEQKRNKYARK